MKLMIKTSRSAKENNTHSASNQILSEIIRKMTNNNSSSNATMMINHVVTPLKTSKGEVGVKPHSAVSAAAEADKPCTSVTEEARAIQKRRTEV